jgi:hypothetical protein
VTRLLAEEFDLPIYSSDAVIGVHSKRLDAQAAPLLERFRRMSMDERWVQHEPGRMYRDFPWFHGEGFDLLVEDLGAMPRDRLILAEGFRLLPHLVRPRVSDPRHAAWLLPTPEFRRAAFLRREGAAAFWQRTSDPGRALTNLLERDRLFTDVLANDAASNDLEALGVDGSRSVEELARLLAARFGLAG